ncbi:MAG TPA: ParB/RepB/Spo0J family partition protein [Geomonas sp.]|nr:ParB/RepB/Spo0J family partition protein [Geomonas sp.]
MSPKGYTPGKLYVLNLCDLMRDPLQPQRSTDEESLAELTASVKKHDVLEPILVRRGEEEKFVIVAGERRYQASVAAGRTTIPAIVTTGDPLEVGIVENLLRQGYTAIEEAEVIERLRSTKNYQLCDLAGIVGKAESTLCEILSLNRLPKAVKDDCRGDHKAPVRILAEIAKQRSEDKMAALYEKYKSKGLTRGEIRSRRTTLKEEALVTAAVQAAARTVEEEATDVSFVSKFAKRLAKLDAAQLEGGQIDGLLVDLVSLRVAINAAVKQLKARQLPAAPPPSAD